VRETRGANVACVDNFPADLTTCPPAAVGTEVQVNGGVHTAPGDTTMLVQTGDTRFRLLPDSSLRYVAKSGATTDFLLTAGRLFADHDSKSGDILIKAGNSAISALGTLFSVGIENGQTVVSVQDGTVAVEVPPGSKQVRNVTKGQGMLIPAGATAPPLPRPMTPGELRLWQRIGPNLTFTP
jgi:ferric-dicitrate binding protein FerR (iron transport regulator)